MKPCKDCIHYDVCLGAIGEYLIKTCDNFKDKSKFIELSNPISRSNYFYIIPTIYSDPYNCTGLLSINMAIKL